MVVPVLITSCQVSEYLNTGPVTAQTNTTVNAVIKAAELPVACVAQLEKRSKKFSFLPAITIPVLFNLQSNVQNYPNKKSHPVTGWLILITF